MRQSRQMSLVESLTNVVVGYVVVDGIDELVNTRIKGRTYIVESTQRLITLKSGESFLCIQYVGPK